jgi:lysophospholipase L1-like esterase
MLKNCERDCSILGPQDHVVIMGGANDMAKNETKNCINTLKKTLSALTSTNVVVLNIPTRHDLITESIANKEIRKANIDIYKICKRFKNIKVLDISNISRELYSVIIVHLFTVTIYIHQLDATLLKNCIVF